MLFVSPHKNVLLLTVMVALLNTLGVLPGVTLPTAMAAGDGGGSTAGGFGVETYLSDYGAYHISPRVVTYDYYEALNLKEDRDYATITQRLKNYDFGLGGMKWEDRVSLAISRLDRVNPTRAKRYREYLQEMVKNFDAIRFEKGTDLSFASDIGMASTCNSDKQCRVNDRLIQIAKQASPNMIRKYRYLIDKEYWNEMDEVQRAILMLHEIVYRDNLTVASHLHETSELTRYFTMYLWSKNAKAWKLPEYIGIAVRASLQVVDDHLQNQISLPNSETAILEGDTSIREEGFDFRVRSVSLNPDLKSLKSATHASIDGGILHKLSPKALPAEIEALVQDGRFQFVGLGQFKNISGNFLPNFKLNYDANTGKLRTFELRDKAEVVHDPKNSQSYSSYYFKGFLPDGLTLSHLGSPYGTMDDRLGLQIADYMPGEYMVIHTNLTLKDRMNNQIPFCNQQMYRIAIKTGEVTCVDEIPTEFVQSLK